MQKSIVALAVTFVSFFVTSCTKTDDTKPFFDIVSPSPGEPYFTSDSINFEATFYDNEELKQYKIEVRNNFGGQETALPPWQPVFVYDLNGTEETVQKYFSIPDTIPSGWYLFIVKAVDIKGNGAHADTTPIFIQNAIDVAAPVIDISSPVDSAIYAASDSLIISALISDNLKLFKLYVNVSNENSTVQLHSETKNHPGNPYNFYLVLHNLDTIPGWYKLSISASDSMNNSAFTERKFLIQ